MYSFLGRFCFRGARTYEHGLVREPALTPHHEATPATPALGIGFVRISELPPAHKEAARWLPRWGFSFPTRGALNRKETRNLTITLNDGLDGFHSFFKVPLVDSVFFVPMQIRLRVQHRSCVSEMRRQVVPRNVRAVVRDRRAARRRRDASSTTAL